MAVSHGLLGMPFSLLSVSSTISAFLPFLLGLLRKLVGSIATFATLGISFFFLISLFRHIERLVFFLIFSFFLPFAFSLHCVSFFFLIFSSFYCSLFRQCSLPFYCYHHTCVSIRL